MFKLKRTRAYERLLISIFFIFISKPSHGFESWPEYRWLERSRAQSLPRPDDLSSEYVSDWHSYLLPDEFEELRRGEKTGAVFSFGSVSSYEFITEASVRLRADINDHWRGFFTWFQDQDLDEQMQQQVFEVQGWNRPQHQGLGLAVFGSMAFDKSNNDVGLALLTSHDPYSTRTWIAWPNFQLNKRNRQSDRWIKKSMVVGQNLTVYHCPCA